MLSPFNMSIVAQIAYIMRNGIDIQKESNLKQSQPNQTNNKIFIPKKILVVNLHPKDRYYTLFSAIYT
jgi:hypothetical protein